jgi:hypothetical protein
MNGLAKASARAAGRAKGPIAMRVRLLRAAVPEAEAKGVLVSVPHVGTYKDCSAGHGCAIDLKTARHCRD